MNAMIESGVPEQPTEKMEKNAATKSKKKKKKKSRADKLIDAGDSKPVSPKKSSKSKKMKEEKEQPRRKLPPVVPPPAIHVNSFDDDNVSRQNSIVSAITVPKALLTQEEKLLIQQHKQAHDQKETQQLYPLIDVLKIGKEEPRRRLPPVVAPDAIHFDDSSAISRQSSIVSAITLPQALSWPGEDLLGQEGQVWNEKEGRQAPQQFGALEVDKEEQLYSQNSASEIYLPMALRPQQNEGNMHSTGLDKMSYLQFEANSSKDRHDELVSNITTSDGGEEEEQELEQKEVKAKKAFPIGLFRVFARPKSQDTSRTSGTGLPEISEQSAGSKTNKEEIDPPEAPGSGDEEQNPTNGEIPLKNTSSGPVDPLKDTKKKKSKKKLVKEKESKKKESKKKESKKKESKKKSKKEASKRSLLVEI